MHQSVMPSDRIEALDLLRGVAICGILLMNIQEMGTFGHYDTPRLPAAWDADWLLWGVQHLLFEGTMRGLFTMLFGAGMLLMLRRADGPRGEVTPVDAWTRRCLCLMALGVVQWLVLLWPGEILWNYGVTGLFLLAFRRAPPRWLWRLALVLLLGVSIAYAAEDSDTARTLRTGFVAERVQAGDARSPPIRSRRWRCCARREPSCTKAPRSARGNMPGAPTILRSSPGAGPSGANGMSAETSGSA